MPKFSPSFYPELGDKCHQQQAGMFPVMCVTDLEDKILLSNFPSVETRWVITKGRVNITTYWDASTAYFQCTLAALDILEDIPPAPGNLYRRAATKDDFNRRLNKSESDNIANAIHKKHPTEDALQAHRSAVGAEVANSLNNEFSSQDVKDALKKQYPDLDDKLAGALAQDIVSDLSSIREDKESEDETPTWKKDSTKLNIEETIGKVLSGYIDGAVEIAKQEKVAQNTEAASSPGQGDISGTEEAQDAAAQSLDNVRNDSDDYDASVFYLDVNDQNQFDYEDDTASEEVRELPLSTLDEICIYLGYLPEMRPVTKEDILENRLLRRGVWVIDTITRSGGASTGVIMTIQCRDRLKYLMDTFGSYNTAESDDILVEDLKNYRTDGDKKAEESVVNRIINKRSDVILKISRRGIGQTNQFSIGGRRINAGWIYDAIVESQSDGGDSANDTSLPENSGPGQQNLNRVEDSNGEQGDVKVQITVESTGDVWQRIDGGYQRVSTVNGETITRQFIETAEGVYYYIEKNNTGTYSARTQKEKFQDFERKFNQYVYDIPVGADGPNRAAIVNFSNGWVTIPMDNGRVGIYKPSDNEGKIVYAEYDAGTNLVIEGTAKEYDVNHPEYVDRREAAKIAEPSAWKRGVLNDGDSSTSYGASDSAQEKEFDPFRPYKGSQTIVVENAQLGSISGEDNKVISTDESVETYLNMSDDKWAEIIADINDDVKNIIKQHLKMDEKQTLTIPDYRRYVEAFGTHIFTKVRADGTVRALQYVNSLQGSTKNRAVSKEMRFNIITGRGSYLKNSDSYIGQDFIVTDRAPLDYIHYLAQQEPWPTVVFQDSRTGEFWYVPRGLDTSGLKDPSRFNRTYFFRQYPEDLTVLGLPRNNPHLATMLHSFREEESSVSTRTNVLVQSHAPKAMTNNNGHYLHISIVPPHYKTDRGRAYAASFYTVTDNTATQNPGALIATALSYARVLGKELKSGAATLLGDPSLIPGEAVQIIGSPAQQDYVSNPANIIKDRDTFYEMNAEFEEFFTDLPELIRDYTPDSPPDLGSTYATDVNGRSVVFEPSPNEDSTDKIMVNAAQDVQEEGTNTIKFKSEPATLWRVEAIIDKFNDGVDGYYTEVSLMSCF